MKKRLILQVLVISLLSSGTIGCTANASKEEEPLQLKTPEIVQTSQTISVKTAEEEASQELEAKEIPLVFQPFESDQQIRILEESLIETVMKEYAFEDKKAMIVRKTDDRGQLYGVIEMNDTMYDLGPISMFAVDEDRLEIQDLQLYGRTVLRLRGVMGANYGKTDYFLVDKDVPSLLLSTGSWSQEIDLDEDGVEEIISIFATVANTCIYKFENDQFYEVHLNAALDAAYVYYHNDEGGVFEVRYRLEDKQSDFFRYTKDGLQRLDVIPLQFEEIHETEEEREVQPIDLSSVRKVLSEQTIHGSQVMLVHKTAEDDSVHIIMQVEDKAYDLGAVSWYTGDTAIPPIVELDLVDKKAWKIDGVFGANYGQTNYYTVENNVPKLLLSVDSIAVEKDLDHDGYKEIVSTIGTRPITFLYRYSNEKFQVVNLNDALGAIAVTLLDEDSELFEAYFEGNPDPVYFRLARQGIVQVKE